MNKTTIKSFVLIALLAMPNFIQAQTFKGISEELKANNTPEGWKKVDLPQLPEITEKNTFNIVDYGATTSADDNTKAIQKASRGNFSTRATSLIEFLVAILA